MTYVYYRVRTGSCTLEKVLKFPLQFFKPGKSLENGKKSSGFFQSYKCFRCDIKSFWSDLIQSRPFLRSPLITYLITLSLEKEIIVLKKQSGKSLEFWIRKSVRTLLLPRLFSFQISNFHYPFAYLQFK